ncbi:hypothetical protein TIFTF001_046522 [Ficus carica]|uniref:Uncharacterized protein n=1 Tax=Ficus carica TaxID=3494 RepID=A0AA87ZAQ6_FICCA|nr:hypothetical protein TIFTF001_046522 [Ficus carica]
MPTSISLAVDSSMAATWSERLEDSATSVLSWSENFETSARYTEDSVPASSRPLRGAGGRSAGRSSRERPDRASWRLEWRSSRGRSSRGRSSLGRSSLGRSAIDSVRLGGQLVCATGGAAVLAGAAADTAPSLPLPFPSLAFFWKRAILSSLLGRLVP